jgi:hypothetical protein
MEHSSIGDDIDIYATARSFVENAGEGLKGLTFALNFIHYFWFYASQT